MRFLRIAGALILGLVVSTSSHGQSPIRPGDHVAIVGNTFADQLRIHGYLETLLLQATSDDPISIRNLGWGGDMLTARDRPTGFPSEESTLKDHKTDVIIACFGMGESFAGKDGLDDFKTQLTAFFASHSGKSYNDKSVVRLILVSPIAYEDHSKLTPRRDDRNDELQAYTQAMREVASTHKIPFVDLFERSRYLMDEPTGPKLTTNGIHLNPYGYWAISRTFFDELRRDQATVRRPWLLRVDTESKTASAVGVVISGVAAEDSGISFQVKEMTLPTPGPPAEGQLPEQLEVRRDRLVVKDLSPGIYKLSIDGEPVVSAAAADWADGVAVDASPAHQAVEAYRRLVNDKNLQFTYSWKALNQVHIVGERRSSPSGRALPQEVIEFNKLANQRDQELSRQVGLKTRTWRLKRVEE